MSKFEDRISVNIFDGKNNFIKVFFLILKKLLTHVTQIFFAILCKACFAAAASWAGEISQK